MFGAYIVFCLYIFVLILEKKQVDLNDPIAATQPRILDGI